MIQDVGNVELFELFETDPKTQCKACLSYWSGGIVYCTCVHFLKEIVANRGFTEFSLDLSIPEYVIKKGRPRGHRYGKTPGKKEYHLSLNLKRDASKENSRGSMIVFYEIMFSVNGCSKTIEMKMFVVNGTFLQNKTTPIECQNQNTFTTNKIGASLSTSRETPRTH